MAAPFFIVILFGAAKTVITQYEPNKPLDTIAAKAESHIISIAAVNRMISRILDLSE